MPGNILSIFRLFMSICLYNFTTGAQMYGYGYPPSYGQVMVGNGYPPPYGQVVVGNEYPPPYGPVMAGNEYPPAYGPVMTGNRYPAPNVEIMQDVVCENMHGRIVCARQAPYAVQPVPVAIIKPSTESDCDTESEEYTSEESNTLIQQRDSTVERNCGLGLNTLTPLVHYGTPVSTGIFPWVVALYTKPWRGGKFLCGGSLLSARTVITAAHCFRNNRFTKHDVELHIGRHNLNDDNEEYKERNIQHIIIHPQYRRQVSDADIAIVQFSESVGFNERIKPICLWSGPTDLDELVGKKGSVAGWGLDENGRLANILKMVNADIVDENTCIRQWGNNISPRTFCASNLDGSGPCSGDSGSAFMIQRDGRWLLRGIVSAGHKYNNGQCSQNFYVIYCDVAKHMRWVQQNIIY